MAKKYTYLDIKSNTVIFETVEPNYVSPDDVVKKVIAETGYDPRLSPFIARQIRVVPEGKQKRSTGRYDKNKRMS